MSLSTICIGPISDNMARKGEGVGKWLAENVWLAMVTSIQVEYQKPYH